MQEVIASYYSVSSCLAQPGVGQAAPFETWIRPSGSFSFPGYLSDLLSAIGCDVVRVFDCLDGRQLVPYQAVVCRRPIVSVRCSSFMFVCLCGIGMGLSLQFFCRMKALALFKEL